MTVTIESATYSPEGESWDVRACLASQTGSFCGTFVVAIPESASLAEIASAIEIATNA